jgi:glycosyltransferase involved in cell wall biosynthesis
MPRRILFDALAARYGGGAYAAVQLAKHLAAHPMVQEVVVVARRGSIVQRSLADDGEVRCVALAEAPRLDLIRRIAWEALRESDLARREQCDVLISMAALPRRTCDQAVVCLLGNPVMYEVGTLANRLRRWAVRRTATDAAYLAAPSRVMADLVSDSVGRECAVLPWGVDHGVFSPASRPGEEILCVADFYAHKRHDLLLEAWLRLSQPRPRLRLIGNPQVDPDAHARVLARVAALPDAGRIVFEHRVSLAQLVSAYRAARVFVMPSEHESFCLPLAESLACGVPAVARDTPSLRETGDSAAIYIEGDDPDRWAAAIHRLIEDDREHRRARDLGVGTAARFSWETCAATLVSHL